MLRALGGVYGSGSSRAVVRLLHVSMFWPFYLLIFSCFAFENRKLIVWCFAFWSFFVIFTFLQLDIVCAGVSICCVPWYVVPGNLSIFWLCSVSIFWWIICPPVPRSRDHSKCVSCRVCLNICFVLSNSIFWVPWRANRVSLAGETEPMQLLTHSSPPATMCLQ